MTAEAWSAWIAGGALAMSIFALVRSETIAHKQMALQKSFEDQETTLDGRRFFAVLWEQMHTVNHLNPDNPIPEQVRHVTAVLTLVALSWEAGIVDKKMVVLAFGRMYQEVYGELQRITRVIPTLNMTGRQIIMGSPEITRTYEAIRDVNLNQLRVDQ